MDKYVIGIDYGTLSARALLVNAKNGQEIGSESFDYPMGIIPWGSPHGIMDKSQKDYALQDPKDYLEALSFLIANLLETSKIDKDRVIGLSIDFTASTMIPLLKDGTPLSFLDEFKDNKHAYVKLWKHHGAKEESDLINKQAQIREEAWLKRYGGKISCEWELPKLMEILNKAPEVFERMDYFLEAGDWITWLLTGQAKRNSSCAGYKGLWSFQDGNPSKDFLASLDKRLENVFQTKFGLPIQASFTRAGFLSKRGQELTGLNPSTAIGMANIDGHASVPGAGIKDEGKLLLMLGTSFVHKVLHKEEKYIPGICGVVKDGILPGFYGYEAGQSAGGDHFSWFMDNCLPYSYYLEAKERNIDTYSLMREKASKLRPGQSGLIALDWWNGNRSIVNNPNLKGLILGMNLQTKAEDIYRALIEATAFGTRTIIDNFTSHGLEINEIISSGGISKKDPLTMQIMADVTNREIHTLETDHASALGSAIFASCAARVHENIFEAIEKMTRRGKTLYKPNKDNVIIYDKLYREYKILHDQFAKNNMMEKLSSLSFN